MKPKISICIPTYNKFKTIEFTIESVINQSFSDWELIIVDDSDNGLTQSVVSSYIEKDIRIRYVKNIKRLGLVKNWNECINQAKYDYIYILHHDDFLMPGILDSYVKFAESNPDCGMFHSNCYYLTLPHFYQRVGVTQKTQILKRGDEAIEKVLFHNNIACSSVMVKKECYKVLGGFDENAWVSPDWEMWARIGLHYNIGHLDDIGCAVVLDNQNTHLTPMNLDEFCNQQKYYSDKIVSYFSEEYLLLHPEVYQRVSENMLSTIRGLGFHYLSILKINTADNYFEKIGMKKNCNYYLYYLKSIVRYLYRICFVQKRTYGEIFNLVFRK